MSLKFSMLHDHLAKAAPSQSHHIHIVQQLVSSMSHLTMNQLLQYGSPFFWFNVNRCFKLRDQSDDHFELCINSLIVTAFDTFFSMLPNDVSLKLLPNTQRDWQFPNLGIQTTTQNLVALTKHTESRFRLETSKGPLEFDILDIDDKNQLSAVLVPGYDSIKLLYGGSDPLFDSDAHANFLLDRTRARGLAKMLSSSLNMIREVDAALHKEITDLVKWFVALNRDDVNTHQSYSMHTHVGVIFLSEGNNPLQLAQAIVHEFGHNQLHLITTVTFVLKPEARGKLLYSPWRTDPRPPMGLIHALHVFLAVENFLKQAEEKQYTDPVHGDIKFERIRILHQLRIGIKQVPAEDLEPFGCELLQAIESGIKKHEDDIGSEPAPLSVRKHLQEWIGRNPSLVVHGT